MSTPYPYSYPRRVYPYHPPVQSPARDTVPRYECRTPTAVEGYMSSLVQCDACISAYEQVGLRSEASAWSDGRAWRGATLQTIVATDLPGSATQIHPVGCSSSPRLDKAQSLLTSYMLSTTRTEESCHRNALLTRFCLFHRRPAEAERRRDRRRTVKGQRDRGQSDRRSPALNNSANSPHMMLCPRLPL